MKYWKLSFEGGWWATAVIVAPRYRSGSFQAVGLDTGISKFHGLVISNKQGSDWSKISFSVSRAEPMFWKPMSKTRIIENFRGLMKLELSVEYEQ